MGKSPTVYDQTTAISARFSTKKACKTWLQEQYEDGFDVWAEPRRHPDGGWAGGADKRETIESY